MKGITFDNLHSWRDLHLILGNKEMGSPAVKEKKLEIEGADSDLDLTEFFGEPKYENVRHKFPFTAVVAASDLSVFTTVKNALHGKKKRIILDDDPLYFWLGRLFVSSYTNEKGMGIVTIEADCEPYKYKLAKTVVSRAVDGTEAIVLTNARKRAVPEITIETASSLNIVYQGNNIWDLGSGSFTLPELELLEGNNTVTVTGTGNITFAWQEGEL